MAALSDGNFTVASTNAAITEYDNSTDLWPYAIYETDEDQPKQIEIDLRGVKKVKFYFQNNCIAARES